MVEITGTYLFFHMFRIAPCDGHFLPVLRKSEKCGNNFHFLLDKETFQVIAAFKKNICTFTGGEGWPSLGDAVS